jgi:hypothetical protein
MRETIIDTERGGLAARQTDLTTFIPYTTMIILTIASDSLQQLPQWESRVESIPVYTTHQSSEPQNHSNTSTVQSRQTLKTLPNTHLAVSCD